MAAKDRKKCAADPLESCGNDERLSVIARRFFVGEAVHKNYSSPDGTTGFEDFLDSRRHYSVVHQGLNQDLIDIPTKNGFSPSIGGFCRFPFQSAENSGTLDIAII